MSSETKQKVTQQYTNLTQAEKHRIVLKTP